MEQNQKKISEKNKSVKFNKNVTIIKVKSFKEYNKIDEYNNINPLFNDVNYNSTNNINKKKEDGCECIIL